eukprot:TRINITY_DN10548_c0_g1_i2.p1 TRINITY_DN10548_c0_g1~~TRINITY_DN10548_c0_g1_i2.p1  ORF type:complete len:246 (+),score=76.14 TRINITY_DN10548_c0_g1_i2:275-1012(+)
MKDLENFVPKIGSAKDYKGFRKRLKDTIASGTHQIGEAKDLIEILENFSGKEDKTHALRQRKIVKELRDAYTLVKKRFEELVRSIASKEREHIESAKKSVIARKSMLFESRAVGGDNHESFLRQSGIAEDPMALLQEINVDEEMIMEREQDLQNIENIVTELHAVTVETGAKVAQQGSLLEEIEKNMSGVKTTLGEVNDELRKAEDADYIQDEEEGRKKKKLWIIIGVIILLLILGILGFFLLKK